ncbi:MAG: MobQ family relaxase [Phormidesmis sp.]
MAIFSMRMQVIGRSAGRSATAAAAYRSGEEVRDERTGKVHDYTGKSDIYGSEILLPEGAPERLGHRMTLWNEVERVEKRKDAQLSRELMIALPAELTHEQKQALTREYVRGEFTGQGMIADIGYHDFDSHNPHAHIMLTMRSVDENGFGKKRRDWNKRQVLEHQRKAWEEYTNRALERAGYDTRIDHRSLKEQSVKREPQIHLGAQVMEMEARGVRTRVGDESRHISKVNRDIEQREAQREKLQVEIEAEQVTPEPYTLQELVFSSESEIEVEQPTHNLLDESFSAPDSQQSDESLVPTIDLNLIHRLGKTSDRYRNKKLLENSSAIEELAASTEKVPATADAPPATAEEVSEKIDQLIAQLEEIQNLTDGKERQTRSEKERTSAPIVEKKTELVERQKRSERRQKKQAKKRDQGMEL